MEIKKLFLLIVFSVATSCVDTNQVKEEMKEEMKEEVKIVVSEVGNDLYELNGVQIEPNQLLEYLKSKTNTIEINYIFNSKRIEPNRKKIINFLRNMELSNKAVIDWDSMTSYDGGNEEAPQPEDEKGEDFL